MSVLAIPSLHVDTGSEIPVYRQIADGIRRALKHGLLAPGRRLPPTRDLAAQLGVNRNTVVAAYEYLVEQGIASGQTGRGTFIVSPRGADEPDWPTSFARAVEGPGVGGLLSAYRVAVSPEGISFAASYPASDLMPVEAFRRAMEGTLREHGADVLTYGPPSGYAPLRDAIAVGMRARGSRVDGDGILITNGSQQAIELTLRAFVDPGDAVVIENPTYTGALSVLASLGARVIGIPMDDEGLRPDLLARALERHRPRVLYVQPTFHNPTTRVMGEARRREILDLAERHACVVVEDDWAGDLRFEGGDLPTLHALDGGRRVVYLSTFSKKLLPGLRVGWVTAPTPVLQRLAVLKQIEDHGTSLLVQAALHAFLADGVLEDHLERVRDVYRERRDAMLASLSAHMPDGVSWMRPSGGLFLWVTLPEGVDADELFVAAKGQGVLVSRGALFHVEGQGGPTMRLTFSCATREQIEAGTAVLGRLIRARLPEGARPARDEALETVPIL